MQKKKNIQVVKTSIFLIVLWILWEMATYNGKISPYILPPPSKVWNTFIKMMRSGELFHDIAISYLRVWKGFSLAVLLAFVLAMIRILFPKCSEYYESLIQFLKNVPPLSMISLFILWLGIGERTKIAIIVLTSFFPIYLNTVKGFEECDKKLLEVGEIYGYHSSESFLKIRLPYAMSNILVGMRIGLGYSWRSIVAAEMIAASTGLGHMILFAQQMSRTDKVIVGIFAIGVIGYLTDRIFAWLIGKLLKGFDTSGWN